MTRPPVRPATIALIAVALGAAGHAQEFLFEEVHHRLPPSREAPHLAFVRDVDGDPYPDLVATANLRAFRVWLGDVDGAFRAVPSGVDPSPFRFSSAICADLDGDGDPDLALPTAETTCDTFGPTCRGNGTILYENQGLGAFRAVPFPGPTDRYLLSIDAGDVDGDGDLDLVLGVRPHVWIPSWGAPIQVERPENLLYKNLGGLQFVRDASALPADTDSTTAVLLRDFDGDGDLDLFYGNALGTAPQDRLLRNDGSGRFQFAPTALPSDTGHCVEAHAFDVDGDRDLDLLVRDDAGWRLLRNRGNAVFDDASASLPAWPSPFSLIAFADVDGDGNPDLVGREETSWIVGVFLGDGRGAFTLGRAVATHATRPVLLDADADGDLDLIVLGGGGVDDEYFLNDGSGWWQRVEPVLPYQPYNQLDHAVDDVDGDGSLDVLLVSASHAPNTFLRNDGRGGLHFADAGAFTSDRGDAYAIATGDLDADGDLDAVVAQVNGRSLVYRNDGSARFTRDPGFSGGSALAVQLGDLDGDGDLDVYLGTLGTDEVHLAQGGSYAPLAGAVTRNAPTFDAVLADLDADGDLDVATAGGPGGIAHVLFNDGTGRFSERPGALPLAIHQAQGVAAGDLDGDGDVDLLLGCGGGSVPLANRILRNDGAGAFRDASHGWPGPHGRTIGLHLLDVNDDGRLDVLEANFHGAVPSRLLLGDGRGALAIVPDGLPETTPYAHRFASGDLDGDGDPDLVLATQGSPVVLHHQGRHVAWETLPRIGRRLALRIRGPSATPYLLAVAAGTARIPVPGLGTLGLDPTALGVVASGRLDARGTASFATAIPRRPELLGIPVFWQAATAARPAFTNVETTVFTNL